MQQSRISHSSGDSLDQLVMDSCEFVVMADTLARMVTSVAPVALPGTVLGDQLVPILGRIRAASQHLQSVADEVETIATAPRPTTLLVEPALATPRLPDVIARSDTCRMPRSGMMVGDARAWFRAVFGDVV